VLTQLAKSHSSHNVCKALQFIGFDLVHWSQVSFALFKDVVHIAVGFVLALAAFLEMLYGHVFDTKLISCFLLLASLVVSHKFKTRSFFGVALGAEEGCSDLSAG
jgi:hypothetical protein